ncbi:hypothetical protein AA309_29875 [Microvirga vignae]|uniref:Uncharacterized protein n=1 Tax=Microvirga vignae TaxID=1225564 RepID=A0A0H1R4I6_9HYPH|nr:hypothetical protein AA309_29875 [Microvirga vignae]
MLGCSLTHHQAQGEERGPGASGSDILSPRSLPDAGLATGLSVSAIGQVHLPDAPGRGEFAPGRHEAAVWQA